MSRVYAPWFTYQDVTGKWHVGGDAELGDDFTPVANVLQGQADADRIVDCVNACAPIRNPKAIEELISKLLGWNEMIERLYPMDERTLSQIGREMKSVIEKLTDPIDV